MRRHRSGSPAGRRARDVGALRRRGVAGLCAGTFLGLVVCCSPAGSAAQLTPPGLGEARTAGWFALGARQDLDAVGRRESMTYIGVGSISHPNNGNLFEKFAILVLNEELYDNFRRDLYYSLGLSYRRQHRHQSEPPFARADPGARNELRLYGRFGHVFEVPRFELKNTFRAELRTFFAPGLPPDEEVFQFRLRVKTQATWIFDEPGVHRLSATAEALAANARQRNGDRVRFTYLESRFCVYYSIHPRRAPIVVDFGYMNNLIGTGASLVDVHYLALDVIWKNPFGTPHKR